MSANMKRMKVRLGDLLVEKNLISETQLQSALAEQRKSGRKLGRVLIDSGYVEEEAMLTTLSALIGIPYVDLSTFELNAHLVKRLPETDARRYRALILKETADGLLVALGDPTDIFNYDAVVKALKCPIELAAVKESELLSNIDRMYSSSEKLQSLASEVGRDMSDNAVNLDRLIAVSSKSDAPVVRLIQSVFDSAVKADASDIHIEPDENLLRIRRRIDGILHEQILDEKNITSAMVSRLKLMANADISERRLPQDGRFTVNVKDQQIDVRLSTIPTQHGEGVVMRLLNHSNSISSLSELGMPEVVLNAFSKIIHKPNGLILVTGPTGSGKTTTLYSALHELNTPQRKIITIEDPVEYRMSRVNQVQVNNKVGLDFARVLRTALRLDPDVLLLGEIRDHETGEIALRASLTGHLVLSTLHTNDAVSTALRLMDMGLEAYLLASSIKAILAQRLIRRICTHCSSTASPDANEQAWLLEQDVDKLDNQVFRRGNGCNNCNHTGYNGRIGIYELLVMEPALAKALCSKDQSAFQIAAQKQSTFQPLLRNAINYACDGVTTIEEVMRMYGWTD
ncbi:MAG: type II/IV secretion system protein [Rhodothermales bacterium]|nr:type II/IV secretion system protein [Rhodothermales bacterium]